MCVQTVSALMMEMIATRLFFVYCVSNFELGFYFEKGLTKPFTRVTIQHLQKEDEVFSALCCLIVLTTCLSSLDMSLTTYAGRRVSSLLSVYFFSASGVIFKRIYHPKTRPHIIFSDMDLTTFLTIVTSGVHGDKMSGEYEKAVFA